MAADEEPAPCEVAAVPPRPCTEDAPELLVNLSRELAKDQLSLEPGWRATLKPRAKVSKGGVRADKYFHSPEPDSREFRSVLEVKRYLMYRLVGEPEEVAEATLDDGPRPRPSRAAKDKPPRADEHQEEAPAKRSKKSGSGAAAEEATEEAEEPQEAVIKQWNYRTKKGTFGPFSLKDLRGYRAGFERLGTLGTLKVWRTGQDEESDSVTLLSLLDA